MSLTWHLGSALKPLQYFGNHLLGIINNYISSSERLLVEEIHKGTFTTFFCSIFSLITRALQQLEHPWVIKILRLGLVRNLVLAFYEVKQLFRNITQAPRHSDYRWQGMWENMGRYLARFSPPMVWHFTPKQVQELDEVMECLKKKKCSGYSKAAQFLTACWGLASTYRTLLNTIQHRQGGERVSGSENKPTDTVVKPETHPAFNYISHPCNEEEKWK